jgi:phosphatidylserine decarboxylase
MSVLHSLAMVLAPPHRTARPFLIGGGIALLLGTWLLGGFGFWLALGFLGFCLFFFRDPERVPPARPGLIVAPADGRVLAVGPAVPPAELGLGPAARLRVSIFLSVMDVHVNRAPAEGTVTAIAYRHGAFLNASLDKASELNERNAIVMRLPNGTELAVVQIAGLVARRIVCDVRVGDALAAGERFGIIRFGSRTDLYLPPDMLPLVATGQTMVGGETVIAAPTGAA